MIQITNIIVTDFQQNCRIITTEGAGGALVIDPGGESDRILAEITSLGKSCEEIWLTHSHLDHCGGVSALKEATGAKLVGHPDEKIMRESIVEYCQMFGIPPRDMNNCPEPDRYIKGGETLTFEGEDFAVLFTPGHSPGHVSFYHKGSGNLIAGDTLFAGSIGRTDLPGGVHHQLIQSIEQEIFTLPPDTVVLSGHGPDTTVGKEKETNPFFQGALR